MVAGIAIGGFIHGYAPEDFLVRYAGRPIPVKQKSAPPRLGGRAFVSL